MQEKQFKIDVPFGSLYVVLNDAAVLRISVSKHEDIDLSDVLTAFEYNVYNQLMEYFSGKRRSFDFPIDISCGTYFQQKVWAELYRIPYGCTKSYGEIASLIGKPGVARAVGLACNRNPLLLVIPCHRVVGKNNNLVGFAGGLEIKRYLLDMENENKKI